MRQRYSGKFSRRCYRIQLSSDKLGEQEVLKSAFSGLSESLKSKKYYIHYKPPVSSFSEVGTYVLSLLLDYFKIAYSICVEEKYEHKSCPVSYLPLVDSFTGSCKSPLSVYNSLVNQLTKNALII